MHDVIPVLEIGGTHTTTALVRPGEWRVIPGSMTRVGLRSNGSAEEILSDIAAAGRALSDRPGAHWAVAIPGPFDYERGIALFEHVGKFDSLHGLNIRDELIRRLSPAAASVEFLNDADAFGVGEYAAGSAAGYGRAVCITLGTGVGSAFLVEGVPQGSGTGVPPNGNIHVVVHRGRTLEEIVSRRAIRKLYADAVDAADATEGRAPDVREIAQRSRAGDDVAAAVLSTAFRGLGEAIAPYLESFQADVLVVGGSMARSWDLLEPPLREGLAGARPSLATLRIQRSARPEESALIGAAYWASRRLSRATRA
jgi:glucokinase